jgi:hypothetical protein
MIIDSTIFDSCWKDDKNFFYQFDTSDCSLTLVWEWLSDGSRYRYGRMIGRIEMEQLNDLAFFIKEIADERNWR